VVEVGTPPGEVGVRGWFGAAEGQREGVVWRVSFGGRVVVVGVVGVSALVRCSEAGLEMVVEAERGRRGVDGRGRAWVAVVVEDSAGWVSGEGERVRKRRLLMVREASYSGG
jgi:hypothetical protein